MSAPASPAAASSPPRASGLRPVALAVVVLAAADVLLTLGHGVLLVAARRSEAAEIAAQIALFAGVVVSSLLAAAVVVLVRRATTADGRTATSVLLALGLLTLALLTEPLSSTLSSTLFAALPPGDVPGPLARFLPLATAGIAVLCTLGLGLVALLLAVRGGAAPGTGRALGRPMGLAAALCGLAVVAALLLPVHLLVARFLVADSPAIALLAGVPALLAGIARVLLVPVGALLIARTAAAPRRLTWAVLIVLWADAILTALSVHLLMLQLILGGAPDVYALWNGLSIALQTLSAVILLVLSAVVLVQVRASRRSPAAAL